MTNDIPQTAILPNTAFILGAGFSKDVANLPTMKELSEKLKIVVHNLNEPIKTHLLKNIPQNLWHDFESLLTYLYSSSPWTSPKDNHLNLASFYQITESVAQIIEQTRLSSESNEALIELASYWQETLSPVITFNYDLVVEECVKENIGPRFPLFGITAKMGEISCNLKIETFFFRKILNIPSGKTCIINHQSINNDINIKLYVKHGLHEIKSESDFNKKIGDWMKQTRNHENSITTTRTVISSIQEVCGKVNNQLNRKITNSEIKNMYQLSILPLESLESRSSRITFPYYKLHGSINWLYSGLHEIQDEPIHFRNDNEEYLGLIPVIIPPVLDKNSFYRNHTLKVQWNNALKALRDDHIDTYYFVGYSFPPTDMTARYLFNDAFSNRTKNITLYIVDYCDADRLKRLIHNYLTTLAGFSDEEAQEKIVDSYTNNVKEITNPDTHITLNWSLCRIRSKDSEFSSSVKVLVEHLKNNTK